MEKGFLKGDINPTVLQNNLVARNVAKDVRFAIWRSCLLKYGTLLSPSKMVRVRNSLFTFYKALNLNVMHHQYLVCGEKTLGLFSKLLSICDEPEWVVTNENFLKILEYMLWDAFKKGISLHLAECTKCVFIDLDIMLALLSKALGRRISNE